MVILVFLVESELRLKIVVGVEMWSEQVRIRPSSCRAVVGGSWFLQNLKIEKMKSSTVALRQGVDQSMFSWIVVGIQKHKSHILCCNLARLGLNEMLSGWTAVTLILRQTSYWMKDQVS